MSKSERDARYHKERRRRGLCRQGGCKRKSGDSVRCDKHAEKHAAAEKARREARRALKAAA